MNKPTLDSASDCPVWWLQPAWCPKCKAIVFTGRRLTHFVGTEKHRCQVAPSASEDR